MYQKGQTAVLAVNKVTPKLDANGRHKSFRRQDGTERFVFDIEFVNGYKAEYTYPGITQPDFIQGKTTEFRVIDVNNFGPTIEPVIPVNKTMIGSNGMSGHPAVFALGFAKDLAPHLGWNLQQTMDGADELLEWLLLNKNKTSLNAE